MTPKEKAEDIVNKMYKSPYVQETEAKRCALIAVEEIIKELGQLRKPEYTTFVLKYGEEAETMDGYEKIDYYQQVKQEIEKL